MKKFYSLMIAVVIAVSCLFSSCESYDAGPLKKTDILGIWYNIDDDMYVLNKDGSYSYYPNGEYSKDYSGTFAIDREARTWVKNYNRGYSAVFTILLLSDTTFAFADEDGDIIIWTRDK